LVLDDDVTVNPQLHKDPTKSWGLFGILSTVGGSEIRHTPVEVGSLSQFFTMFYTSQVVQDFCHQQ